MIMQLHIKRFYYFLCNTYLKRLGLTSLLFTVTLTSACGKRMPPLPPAERVVQRVAISGTQIGNKVNLVWQMPARNASGGSLLNITRVDVYRLAEPLTDPLSLTESEFADRSTLIATVPVTDSDFALNQKTYVDTLQFAGQEARLRYAIRFVNASGQKAAFSNFFLIEPTSKIANNPTSLKFQVTQEAVRLVWDIPTANVDGSAPANILGYNVYRRGTADQRFKRLNDQPVKTPAFSDNFFEFEKRYNYLVRAVSLGRNGQPVESDGSNAIDVLPRDTFPPAPPNAITIAAAPNNISIFFATNIEKDVVGYRVYRTTNPNLPKSAWELLTPQNIKTNTFQDTRVESGKTYHYYLTAIDKFRNVSEPSEVVTENAL